MRQSPSPAARNRLPVVGVGKHLTSLRDAAEAVTRVKGNIGPVHRQDGRNHGRGKAYETAKKVVRARRNFYGHAMVYAVVNSTLFAIDAITPGDHGSTSRSPFGAWASRSTAS